MKKSNVWVIGLDGATFELIKPWIKAGKLPAFARLESEGAYGILSSPVPQSPPAWTSFMTGCNPGKHGIIDWIQPQYGSYAVAVATGALNKRANLWDILSNNKRQVGVVNVPMTYPPKKIDGFLVSGYESPFHNRNYTHPPQLLRELESQFGPYIILPQIVDIPLSQTAENFLTTINQRERIMFYLLEKYNPDFFMLVFNAADSLQHLCLQSYTDKGINSDHLTTLYKIYRRFDDILQRLMEQQPHDATLIVMSDHGAGPKKRGVLLNHWLAQQGWLHFDPTHNSKSSSNKGARQNHNLISQLKAMFPASIKTRMRDFLGKYNQNTRPSDVYSSFNLPKTRALLFPLKVCISMIRTAFLLGQSTEVKSMIFFVSR